MSNLKFLLLFLLIQLSISKKKTFQLLRNFTCAVVKDELEKHPEMQTIAMIELENNFPSNFSREILKCLPDEVAKVVMMPHTHVFRNNTIKLTKESMIIYVADRIEGRDSFYYYFRHLVNPVGHHLSKFLIVSSENKESHKMLKRFEKIANFAVIYEENRKVIVKSLYGIKKLEIIKTFKSSHHKNLSKILYPEKMKNLEKFPLYVAYSVHGFTHVTLDGKLINIWTHFAEIVAEKLNATLTYVKIEVDKTSRGNLIVSEKKNFVKLSQERRLDFFVNANFKSELECYHTIDQCFLVPIPPEYSIYELILVLPLDKSCWIFLGVTIGVLALFWRLFEGSGAHWNLIFGSFALFVGKSIKIRV